MFKVVNNMYICNCTVLFMFLVYMICYCKPDACSSWLCRCEPEDLAVLCNYKGLTYIPKLPANTQTLYFDYNKLPKIDSNTFNNISGLSYLTDLSLICDNISIIELNTFSKLRSLKNLTFSLNYLTSESLKNLTSELKQITTLNYLLLVNMLLKAIPSGWFHGIEKSNINYLDFNNNSITKVNLTEFKPLTKLEHLDLSHNQIMSLTIDKLPRLTFLNLKSNKLKELPNFCHDEGAFPELQELDLSENQICDYNAGNMNCLTKLRILRLNYNCFSVFKSGSFHNLLSLTHLYLHSTKHPNKPLVIEDYAFNNSRLEQLILSYAKSKVLYIKEFALAGCPSLQVMDLSYIHLNDQHLTTSHKLSIILSRLGSFKYLYVEHCGLDGMPVSIRNLVSLHTLLINGNKILTWPDNFWIKTTNLSVLSLSNNMIKCVTQEMFPVVFRHQLHHLEMAYNPIDCSSANLWYINWLRDRKEYLFYMYPDGYSCLNMTETETSCLEHNPATSNAIIGLTCFLITFIVIGSLYYKYKWLIKYKIYILRQQPKVVNNMAAREFLYDVFVSYCKHDEKWIFDYLLPNIESDTTKLCVHTRDFMPGKMIIDNIVEAIEDSRRVLIVLGNEFAKSKWCQFELTLALTLETETLAVVLLDDIEAEYMTNSLQALLKTTTYITWCGDQDQYKVPVIWERLKYSLDIEGPH